MTVSFGMALEFSVLTLLQFGQASERLLVNIVHNPSLYRRRGDPL